MADRIFERILNQTAADVEAKQQQQDPELRRKKAQVRCRWATASPASLFQLATVPAFPSRGHGMR